MSAITSGNEIQSRPIGRVQGRMNRIPAGKRNGRRGHAVNTVGIVKVAIIIEVAAPQVAVKCTPQAVDDSWVGLQAHAPLQAPYKHPGNLRSLLRQTGFPFDN